ncbi:MAG: hypothetical protein OXC46_11210 [Thaumarchaeota archaeon]|nr:hypothetical protein [Nitrososphaerota archaeon]
MGIVPGMVYGVVQGMVYAWHLACIWHGEKHSIFENFTYKQNGVKLALILPYHDGNSTAYMEWSCEI